MPTTPPPIDLSELQLVLAHEARQLPRLSRVAERFLLDAHRDTASAEDIAGALEADPVLQGWVLRQANSGFCKLSRPVASVAQACVVMGVDTVTRLVYAACTRDLLTRRLACYRYPGQGFWLHALAVGVAARRLAARLGPASPLSSDEALVAGLLHDVGKLVCDRHLPTAGGPRHVTVAEERAALGTDHAACAAVVAEDWELPAPVIAAVAGHHDRSPAPAARLVAVADALVRHWGVGIWTYARLHLDPPLRDLAAPAAPLGLTARELAAWAGDLPPILTSLEEMIRTVGKAAPPALPDGEVVPRADQPAPAGRRDRRGGTRTRRGREGRDRRRR
jgi:putative nucleotidyltransferase with HDIG domain